jgi:hypothetical protein
MALAGFFDPWPLSARYGSHGSEAGEPRRRLPLLVSSDEDDPLPPRPRTRADCIDGPRPCPWVGCQYALYLDVLPRDLPKGPRLKINFPELEPGEMRDSCALDVAEEGQHTAAQIGSFLHLTEERIRQIEIVAELRLAPLLAHLHDEEATMATKKKKKAGRSNGRFRQAVAASTQYFPKTTKGEVRKDAVVRERRKEKCPVKIPVEDIEKKSQALAKVIQDHASLLEEKRAANAEFNDKVKYFKERMTELAESVTSHTEVRDVECIVFLLERTGEMVTIRQDTGEQVGDARPATADDRQDSLPLGEPSAEKNAEANGADEGDEEDDDVETYGDLADDDDEAEDARPGDGG